MRKNIICLGILIVVMSSVPLVASENIEETKSIQVHLAGYALESEVFYRYLRDPKLYYSIFTPNSDYVKIEERFIGDLEMSQKSVIELGKGNEALIQAAAPPIANVFPAIIASNMHIAFDICDNNPGFLEATRIADQCERLVDLLVTKVISEQSQPDRLRLMCTLEYCSGALLLHKKGYSYEKLLTKFKGISKLDLSNDEIAILGHLYLSMARQ